MKKCLKCGIRTNIYIPQHRLALCPEHYINWFEARTQRTIEEFKMFQKTDRILVAVSGGKDSLSLWNVLVKLGYEADGLHINLGISEYSELSEIKTRNFAQRIGRKLHIVDLGRDFGRTIPQIKENERRPPCSFCGTLKRYYMNLYAREYGYNVLATAHNLDDEVSVLMLNTLSWNIEYLSRQFPVLPEENGFARKVKPFCKMSEKEVAMYAVLAQIDYIEDECPFAEGSTTLHYKKLISQLEEKSPGTKLRFYSEFLSKMYPVIKDRRPKTSINRCKSCGEPTQSEICMICRMRNNLLYGKLQTSKDTADNP